MRRPAVWSTVWRSLCPMLAGWAFIGSAYAQQYVTVTSIFGHEIYVSDQVTENTLMIDGRKALSDGRVVILEIGLAGDTPFVLGIAGSGGNMCGAVPFVVSFATPTPAVDVFPEECMSPPHEVGDGEIRFEAPGNAVMAARAWVWRSEGGFQEVEVAAEDLGSGWDAFRTRSISAPADLLQYVDLADRLRALAGEDFEVLSQVIFGPSDGRYEGSAFMGSNCIAHACPSGGTLVIADLTSHGLYVAWMASSDEGVEVRPPAEEWPANYAEELDRWRSQW